MKRFKRELLIWFCMVVVFIFNPDMRFGKCVRIYVSDECVAQPHDRYYWIALLVSTLVVIIYRYLKNPNDD